jgi:hypothetical protein
VRILPQPPDECHAVGGHDLLGQARGIPEQEDVEEALELLVVAEEHRVQRGGRHCQGHKPPPAVRRSHCRRVGSFSAPVVADEDRMPVSAENLVKGYGVLCQRANAVAAVIRDCGRSVSAHEGSDGAEPGGGQFRKEVPPGAGGVGEAVQAQRQRAGAGFQQPEFQAVRPHPARPYLHPLTLPAGQRRP